MKSIDITYVFLMCKRGLNVIKIIVVCMHFNSFLSCLYVGEGRYPLISFLFHVIGNCSQERTIFMYCFLLSVQYAPTFIKKKIIEISFFCCMILIIVLRWQHCELYEYKYCKEKVLNRYKKNYYERKRV